MFIATVVLLAAAWIAYKVYNRHKEECASKIPGPKAYPLIGNLPLLRNVSTADELLDMFRNECKKFDDYGISKAWLGPLLYVTVYHPKYIEAVARSPNSVHKGIIYNIIFGDGFDGVLLTDDVNKWRELKKPLMKLLTMNLLRNEHYRIFVKEAKNLVAHVREKRLGQELNLTDDAYLFSFDVFSQTHLGLPSDELRNPRFHFIKHLTTFLEYVINTAPQRYFMQLLRLKAKLPEDVAESKAKYTVFFDWLIEETTRREGNKDKFEYYSDFILRRQKENGYPRESIGIEIGDVVVAGSDTTALTLSSTITLLAIHPEIQELAYKEQVSIFGDDKNREPTFEELNLMEYLGRVIKETLRFVSPAILYKYARGDVDLDDYIIPKGTVIGVYLEKLHSDPKYWEHPNAFYPDHFLPEQEAARHKYCYIPFGIGPRVCPGAQYAMAALKIALSFILRNFTVKTHLKFEDITYVYKLLREFKCGYKVTFYDRSNDI